MAKPVRRKSAKNSTPKARASQVTEYWDRAFSDEGYRAVLVKVKNRRGSVVEFFVVDAKTGTVEGDGKKPHRVDLDDGGLVWGDLPSTAQLIGNKDKARYGLLFLVPRWIEKKGGAVVYEGGGGGSKWPKITAL